MNILFIIQLIQIGIAYAPDIIQFTKDAREFVTALSGKGLITVEQQNRIRAHIDVLVESSENGLTPPEFMVEPDPSV